MDSMDKMDEMDGKKFSMHALQLFSCPFLSLCKNICTKFLFFYIANFALSP